MANRLIRVFLVYAEEDYKFRDLLLSLAKTAHLAVEFSDMPTKQPWVERWKGSCRTRIYESDGAIILLSKRTKQGAGVKWEVECALNSGIPLLGVFGEKTESSAVPEELRDERIIEWNWAEIQAFIESLQKPVRHSAGQ
jgi:hypothetical protein